MVSAVEFAPAVEQGGSPVAAGSMVIAVLVVEAPLAAGRMAAAAPVAAGWVENSVVLVDRLLPVDPERDSVGFGVEVSADTLFVLALGRVVGTPVEAGPVARSSYHGAAELTPAAQDLDFRNAVAGYPDTEPAVPEADDIEVEGLR